MSQEIKEYLPLLLPMIAVQLVLLICAVIHILRHEHYKCGNRVIWLLIVCLVNIIGPILYFAVGREEE